MERYNVYTVRSQRRIPDTKHKRKFSIKSFKSISKNKYIALMALIVVGAVIGAVFIKLSGINKTILDGTGFFMQDMLSQQAASRDFFSLMLSAFFPVGVLLCFIFLFGLCAIGLPFDILSTVLFGFWTGGCMASVYLRYGIKGLGICLIFILPQTIINSAAVLISSREAINSSDTIYRIIFKGESNKFSNQFKNYCGKFIKCFILTVVASVIEAAAIKIFALIFFSS